MSSKNFQKLSDKQLLELIKDGNQLAFQHIYNKYWKELYSRTVNVLKDKGKTEDVLHEVFVNIWMKREKVKIGNLKSYLLVAVRNRAILKISEEKYTDLEETLIDELTIPAEIEETFAEKELKRKIEKAIEELPTRRKCIFYMSRYQDYSITEIANHFEISHRTVENQLHLALKHIKSSLNISISLMLVLLNS